MYVIWRVDVDGERGRGSVRKERKRGEREADGIKKRGKRGSGRYDDGCDVM
jgi:hypothetical protein